MPNIKHNAAKKSGKTRAYVAWQGIRQRCHNPKSHGYEYIGGRGIVIHAPWDRSFETFLADLGEPPDGYSLSRIDLDGDFRPGNVEWLPRHRTSQARGESNSRAKLSDDQVRTIYAERGQVYQPILASRYGVSVQLISNIHRGKTWRHITGAEPLPPSHSRKRGAR